MASGFPMVKNTATRIVFPILDADGDLVTGAADLDEEWSLDGGGFTNCDNAATEIGSDGIYYLDLAQGETNGDVVCIQVKTSTAGAKTTVLVFYTSAQSLDAIDTVVDGIQTDLSNASDGLGALKDLIDAVQATANTIEGYTDLIDHATNGLAAIKAEVEGIGGVAMRGTDLAALASAWTAPLATALGDYTAIRAGYLDNLSAGAAALEATLTTMKQTAAGAFDRETDSLEAIRNRGDAAWITGGGGTAADIADAVWDELMSGHIAAGSFGLMIATIEDYVDELESGDKPLNKAKFDLGG